MDTELKRIIHNAIAKYAEDQKQKAELIDSMPLKQRLELIINFIGNAIKN